MAYTTEEIADGVVIGRFLIDQVNLKIAKDALKERLSLTNGRSYPTLVDIRLISNFNNETKAFLATKETSTDMKAGALLVKSVYQKIAGNFFIFLSRPPIPARLFTEEAAAIDWLQQFKD
jgi:hypothetical protein